MTVVAAVIAQSQLVVLLIEKTKQGKLKWELTSRGNWTAVMSKAAMFTISPPSSNGNSQMLELTDLSDQKEPRDRRILSMPAPPDLIDVVQQHDPRKAKALEQTLKLLEEL